MITLSKVRRLTTLWISIIHTSPYGIDTTPIDTAMTTDAASTAIRIATSDTVDSVPSLSLEYTMEHSPA